MNSRQTMKGLKVHNREKVVYQPTNWIAVLEYKQKLQWPNHPDIPENEYDDYNTVYDEGADLEEEENHELIEKNEIDEMMANET